jgi:beta-glucosidase
VGWRQVSLAPGQSRNVEIVLSRDDLRDLHLLEFWDTRSGPWRTPDGKYKVTVGGSFDTQLHDTFRVHHGR